MLEEQPLDAEVHDRAGFSCGVRELDDYLHRFAIQQRRRGIGNIYVLVDTDKPGVILGFYTLSAVQLDAMKLSDVDRKKLPRYPIPCFRLGRLACRKDQKGLGLGRLLIGCAVERCLQARKQVAAFALIVDAKSIDAKAFYEHYGFTPCVDSEETLYLPLG